MCRIPGYCECHKRVGRHWWAYTRSKNPFSRYRSSGREENPKPLPREVKVFKKLKIGLAAAFFGGLVRSEVGDSGNGGGNTRPPYTKDFEVGAL